MLNSGPPQAKLTLNQNVNNNTRILFGDRCNAERHILPKPPLPTDPLAAELYVMGPTRLENFSLPPPEPPDKPILVKTADEYVCLKCNRVCKSRNGLTLHQKKCLKIENGESFLKNEKFNIDQIQNTYDKSDKILPESQPLSSFNAKIDGTYDKSDKILPDSQPLSSLNANDNKDTEKESNVISIIQGVIDENIPKSLQKNHISCNEKNERKLPKTLKQVSVWGTHNEEDMIQIINSTYDEVVFWRKNVFLIPSGCSGKKFVSEMTKLIEGWNNGSPFYREIALKALMVMPALLLQKPSYKSNSKQHKECLSRRIVKWEDGDFDSLLNEARAIQSKLPTTFSKYSDDVAKTFAKHIMIGNVSAALRLLDEQETSGILDLTDSVLDDLKEKHPSSKPENPTVLLNGDLPFTDPIIFENIDETTITKAALRTKGTAGPSGLDAEGWKRILVSKNFGKEGKDLRTAIAKMSKILCTIELEIGVKSDKSRTSLEAYLACRLIPLDKNPGIRPIGIGEVLRRIIGKAVISVIQPEILESAGNLQLCAGQQAGCEAAIHAMTEIFKEESTDALLLVDAENAFNSLNRKVLLHNVRYLCPPMSTYIHNCYNVPSRLFVAGGKEILSEEGTTQGDPFAMPAYAIGILPLLMQLKIDTTQLRTDIDIKHAAYADDIAGSGSLCDLRKWWDNVREIGPLLGYYPKAKKSWLVVKEEKLDEALAFFATTNINITIEGRKYLGGFIGKEESKERYVQTIVDEWIKQLEKLTNIARTEPQAAYAAFICGFKHKFTYHLRAIPNISHLLKPIDDFITKKFIPAITDGHVCTPLERELLSLPPKLGGLGIPILMSISDDEHENSKELCDSLSRNIFVQDHTYNKSNMKEMDSTRRKITKRREEKQKQKLEEIRGNMTKDEIRANDLSQMKGASSWLSSLPLSVEGFDMTKREFFDAIALRYRWQIKYLPSLCPCGKKFDADHALTCLKGGFIHQRHDLIRDTLAKAFSEVCLDVTTEPSLQPLTGEILPKSTNINDEARLDIRAGSFWQKGQRAYFDVRIFNPFAQRYKSQTLQNSFLSNEKEKKKHYNMRVVNIEHGSFTPLVFTPYGGCGREAGRCISELATLVAKKRDLQHGAVLNWLRTKISYTLTKSAVLCLRGSRTVKKVVFEGANIEITNANGKILDI